MPTWDEDKRVRNLHLHGLDFAEAEAIWDAFTVVREDTRERYGEFRWITFGMLRGEVVVLIYTERDGEERFISLRRADAKETSAYFRAASGR